MALDLFVRDDVRRLQAPKSRNITTSLRLINVCGHLLLLFLAALPALAANAPRESVPLTTWRFVEDFNTNSASPQPPESTEWQQVSVPHVFRQSGLADNTAGWYRQTITLSQADADRRVYLMLEGAASVKDIFVNGEHIGQHKGAFSACAFDLTPALKIGPTNILDVRVSNRDTEARNCFSRSGLYYVNGGMFRKAWLVNMGPVHIFPEMGSSGVYLTPSRITSSSAEINARTVVRNPLSSPVKIVVRHFIIAPDKTSTAPFETRQTVPAGQTVTVDANGIITRPQTLGPRKTKPLHRPH